MILRYWKEIVVAGLLALVLFGYWYNIQSAKEAGKSEVVQELQEQTNDTRKAIRNEIRNNKPADRNDASDSLLYLENR